MYSINNINMSLPMVLEQEKELSEEFTCTKRNILNKKRRRSLPEKKVSFSERSQVRYALHHDEYTAEEIAACWYSREESSEITRKIVALIKKIIQGKAQKFCTRGLEHMTPEATEERESRRRDAYNAVLEEQDKQYFDGRVNSESIARRYQQVAATDSQQRACEIGRNDAMMVMKKLQKQKH